MKNNKNTQLRPWQLVFSMIAYKPLFWFLDSIFVAIQIITREFLPAFAMKLFFDLVSSNASAGVNFWTVFTLVLITLIGGIVSTFGFYFVDVPFFAYVMALLRKNLLSNIFKRPGAKALNDSPGEAISRFKSDVEEVPNFILMTNDMVLGAVAMFISFILMAQINILITILALAPIIIVGIIASIATGKIEHYRNESRKASGRVSGFIAEFFGAVQAVKVANAEGHVLSHFESLNEERGKYSLREKLFQDILGSLYRNTSTLGTGVILLLAAEGMRNGSFTVGDFSFFVSLLGNMSGMTTFVGSLLASYKQLGVSTNRMYKLIEGAPKEALVEHKEVYLEKEPPELVYAKKTSADILEKLTVSGLTLTYPSSGRGIKNISFSLKKGSLTIITGRIASGKTSLVRALLGLLPIESGYVQWNDTLIENISDFMVPPRCAYTSQVPRLFSFSVKENILLGLNADENSLIDAVNLAVLEKELESFEEGLETKIGIRGVKLSGGQAQRTAAARMFVRESELLVFDDLSSALDVHTEKELWKRIFSNSERTCLAVSHRKAALLAADQIIVLKDGEIDSIGTYNELLNSSNEFRDLMRTDIK